MKISTDKQAIDEITSRSIAEVYPSKQALAEKLAEGKQLTFYVGIDPTADYVHLGHSTNYLLLERLHKLGHKIIVLVGDFTAMIGDPSDKTSMRTPLTEEDVKANLKTFKNQIGKILDFESRENPIEFKFNSQWLSPLTFKDSVELASNFTVQQMLERDAFEKRIKQQKPLFVHEFFYPLMQGYDSVAMDVDGEIGGTDQTFNMLAGRTLLKRYKNKEKFVITTTLLENPETGEKMMSKSLGTGIGLNEAPKEMFIKTMQLPDAGILQTFIDCTRLSMDRIEDIKKRLASDENPRDIKMILAREIVMMYHGEEAAELAEKQWVSEISNKELASDIKTIEFDSDTDLIEKIVELGVVDSKSKARRLITEGAVKINDKKVSMDSYNDLITKKSILSIGKKHKFKINFKD
ncbi:MAG TPA: tyrosine--tRNA ligase [Candidatus Saccharibacteria bacterium]|nr:tyrosine--tRNA ligase [Candidatus Saccharibacteria bacterium]